MAKFVLEFHSYKTIRPDPESDLVALFLFSIAAAREPGVDDSLSVTSARSRAQREGAFWTEVHLSKDLAARGKWVGLSKHDKLRCMFRWAQEKICERGGKLRQAPMFWSPTGALRDGPPWDPNTIVFPAAPPREFETTQDTHFVDHEAKQAAGHGK